MYAGTFRAGMKFRYSIYTGYLLLRSTLSVSLASVVTVSLSNLNISLYFPLAVADVHPALEESSTSCSFKVFCFEPSEYHSSIPDAIDMNLVRTKKPRCF